MSAWGLVRVAQTELSPFHKPNVISGLRSRPWPLACDCIGECDIDIVCHPCCVAANEKRCGATDRRREPRLQAVLFAAGFRMQNDGLVLTGFHHLTAVTANASQNLGFYT